MNTNDKNKGWFFGDSFTAGDGLRPGDLFYESYPTIRDKRWPELVCDSLDLLEVNLGKGGNSNLMILYDIIIDLHKIKKGDWVFMSDSLIGRFIESAPNGNRIRSAKFDGNELAENLNEQKIVTLDFINKCIYPFEESWKSFYKNKYIGIYRELLTKGVNVIFWSHEVWNLQNKFQTITEYTNSNIVDGHWDWVGQKQMTEYILSIEPNNLFMFNSKVI